jgi:DNA-binding beta-propeller fold protein YncE
VTDGSTAPNNTATGTVTINVAAVSDDDNEIVGTVDISHGAAEDIAFSPDGTKAYVVNGDGTDSVINTGTNALIDTNTGTAAIDPIALPTGVTPTGLATNPNGTQAYVAASDGKIYVIKVDPPMSPV